MSSVYPTGIDTFTTKVNNVDDVMAADINNLQDSIVSIQTALGTGSTILPFVHITGDTITGDLTVSASISALSISGNNISSNNIVSDNITGTEIYGVSISGNTIIVNAMSGNDVYASSIFADGISGNSLTGTILSIENIYDTTQSSSIDLSATGIGLSSDSIFITSTSANISADSISILPAGSSSVNISGSITPVNDAVFDLGSSGTRYKNIYSSGVTTNKLRVRSVYNYPTVIDNIPAFSGSTSFMAGGTARAILVTGNTLVVGGSFSTFMGAGRTGIAAVDISSTQLLPQPAFTFSGNATVYGLAPSLDESEIYAIGSFTAVNGQSNRQCFFTLSSGLSLSSTNLNPVNGNGFNGNPYLSIFTTGNSVFIATSHSTYGASGVYAQLVKFNGTGLTLDTSFRPQPNSTIFDIDAHSSGIAVVGGFTTISGVANRVFAILDSGTGALIKNTNTMINSNISSINSLIRDNESHDDRYIITFYPSTSSYQNDIIGTNGSLRHGVAAVYPNDLLSDLSFDTCAQIRFPITTTYGACQYNDYIFIADQGVSNTPAFPINSPLRSLRGISVYDKTTGMPVDIDFNPDGIVLSTYVDEVNSKLWIGGNFRNICGVPASGLVSIDLSIFD
jgi:hypothetical protein